MSTNSVPRADGPPFIYPSIVECTTAATGRLFRRPSAAAAAAIEPRLLPRLGPAGRDFASAAGAAADEDAVEDGFGPPLRIIIKNYR